MGKKKKKIYRPFDDEDDEDFGEFPFFGEGSEDFIESFGKIIKDMMKSKDFMNFSKNVFKQFGLPSPEADQPEKKVDAKTPFVYGFSVRFDENGKPVFDKFGNIKSPQTTQEEEKDETNVSIREPIADIIEETNEIVVVVEWPGVQKKDIQLNATNYSLEINASSDTYRKYSKRIDLPAKINPGIAKARYTNGILEIRLQKIEERDNKGSNIPIE